jgi:hypothetical protein
MDIETRIAHLEAHCARGWHVFPVNADTKRPATRSGFQAGSTDIVRWRAQWKQRPDWNIGIWTGASSLLVIDCDLDKEDSTSWAVNAFKRAGLIDDGPFGDDGSTIDAHGPGPMPGISVWLEICDAYDFDTEDTYCVVTPSGGLHAYFEYDTDKWDIAPSANRKTNILGELVDIRAEGSYVVGVGSEIDGVEYEWCETSSAHVLPAPVWLLELLQKPPVVVSERMAAIDNDHRGHDEDRVKFLGFMADDIRTAPVGSRNTVFSNKLWRVHQLGGSDVEMEYLCNAAREAGLPDAEIAKTMRRFR